VIGEVLVVIIYYGNSLVVLLYGWIPASTCTARIADLRKFSKDKG